jgi:predicted RNA binding protein YcfA (HicA-like mRNA interferase family)
MKPMKTRKVLAALAAAGCVEIRRSGRHTVYGCPCGKHTAPVPASHTEVTAGVLASIVKQLPCLPKGWLA